MYANVRRGSSSVSARRTTPIAVLSRNAGWNRAAAQPPSGCRRLRRLPVLRQQLVDPALGLVAGPHRHLAEVVLRIHTVSLVGRYQGLERREVLGRGVASREEKVLPAQATLRGALSLTLIWMATFGSSRKTLSDSHWPRV